MQLMFILFTVSGIKNPCGNTLSLYASFGILSIFPWFSKPLMVNVLFSLNTFISKVMVPSQSLYLKLFSSRVNISLLVLLKSETTCIIASFVIVELNSSVETNLLTSVCKLSAIVLVELW